MDIGWLVTKIFSNYPTIAGNTMPLVKYLHSGCYYSVMYMYFGMKFNQQISIHYRSRLRHSKMSWYNYIDLFSTEDSGAIIKIAYVVTKYMNLSK